MFSFYDQLIIYLCEIRDRARLIARLITRSRGLARLNTVWYQQKQNSNLTTAQINAAINNFNIDKFVFQQFKTFYSNSAKEIKINKNENHKTNAKMIIKWINNLKSKTIDFDEKTKLTNVFEKIFNNDEIQKFL